MPKAKGGRDTEPLHPICHRTLHATLSNGQLARIGADLAELRSHPEIGNFLNWISGKPPDFHAPTRKRR